MKLILAIAAVLLVNTLCRAADHSFTIDRTISSGVEVKVDGKPFATYVVDQANKPYLWPIYGPTGKAMTRAFPMEKIDGEQRDHPHHRGITFGHEHINDGVDTWLEQASVGTNKQKLITLGSIKHREFADLKADGDGAMIAETCDYLDHNGKRLLTEQRRITFRVIDDARVIDFDQDLIASDGPVKFVDSKDAGLSIRVPTSMAVDSKQGGRIINANGLADESAWGKPANWCDYTGPVEGEQLGVAFLDHPSSFRHPTNWHVRTYGLFGANPFGAKCFDKTAPDAGIELKAGDRITLRHRFIFHRGDEKAAKIAEAYDAYANQTLSPIKPAR